MSTYKPLMTQPGIPAGPTPGYPPAGYPPPQGGAYPPHGGYPPHSGPPGGYPPHAGFASPPGYGAPAGMPMPGYPMAGGQPNPHDVPQIEALLSYGRLYVQQKVDFTELFVDYDVSNTYYVFRNTDDKANGTRWLLAKEESTCFQRACLAPCREFSMDVGLSASGQNKPNKSLEERLGLVSSDFVYAMLRIRRPCFCCLQSFTIEDGRGKPLAAGQERCSSLCCLCPVAYDIFGGATTVETAARPADYELVGPSRFMIGCIGKCPCRSKFDFTLRHLGQNRQVGLVANVPNGCLKMCCTNADDYEVDFDPSATAPERGILLAMAARGVASDLREYPPRVRHASARAAGPFDSRQFLLDFRHFEAKQEKNNNR